MYTFRMNLSSICSETQTHRFPEPHPFSPAGSRTGRSLGLRTPAAGRAPRSWRTRWRPLIRWAAGSSAAVSCAAMEAPGGSEKGWKVDGKWWFQGVLWWVYDGFMVVLWLIYGGFVELYGGFMEVLCDLPSGNSTWLWKDPPFLMGKVTISMAIFGSYVTNHQRVVWLKRKLVLYG